MQILYDYNISSSWSNTAIAGGYHIPLLQNHSSSTLYKISRLSILSLLNLAVILENSFVILAVISNRRLRNSNNNLLILSLAIADLLLGIFVLPVSIIDHADDEQTLISRENEQFWCAFWQLLDFWLRTASIYSLVVITIDRFLAISFPLKYKVIMNRNAIFIVSLMVWAVSILISLPLLIISRNENGGSGCKLAYFSNFCDRKLITDKIYAVFYATMSFYVPFLVILVFYSKIYCRIRRVRKSIMEGFLNVEKPLTPKRKQTGQWSTVVEDENRDDSRGQQQGAPGRSVSVAGQASPPPDGQRGDSTPQKAKSQDTLRVHAGGYSRRINTYNRVPVHLSRKASSDPATEVSPLRKCSSSEPRIRSITWTCRSTYLTVHQPRITLTKYVHSDHGPTTVKDDEEPVFNLAHNRGSTAEENTRLMVEAPPVVRKISNKHVSVEKKTIRTVGLVIGCFLFCWTGYSSVLVYSSFVGPTKRAARMLTFFTWLGYSNSAINPFIYALCNRQYRKSFANLCRLVTKGKRSSAVTQLTNNNQNYTNNNNTCYSHSFRSHGSICSALMMNQCYGNTEEKLKSGSIRVMANKISIVSNNNGADYFV